ncbi:hypothetical protein R84B8_01448 [Treponema sp. R8-4-B8]
MLRRMSAESGITEAALILPISEKAVQPMKSAARTMSRVIINLKNFFGFPDIEVLLI